MSKPVSKRHQPQLLFASACLVWITIRAFWGHFFPAHFASQDNLPIAGACEVLSVTADGTLLISQNQSSQSGLKKTIRVQSMLCGIELQASEISSTEISKSQLSNAISYITEFCQLGSQINSKETEFRIELGRNRISQNQIALIYLFRNDRCLNEELVQLSLARPANHPAPSAYWRARLKKAAKSR